jgi:hypothetical protein
MEVTMKVLVKYEYEEFHTDIIECPNSIVVRLGKYQEEYDKYAVKYDKEVSLDKFVEWVNDRYLKGSVDKIKIIERGITPTIEQKKYPYLTY